MARCVSNLRNLSQALHLYASDYDGYLPPIDDPGGVTWDIKLLPYLSNSKAIFLCPSDPWPRTGSALSPRSYAANGGVSYAPYTWTDLPFGTFGKAPIHRLDDVGTAKNRLILIAERPGDAPSNRGYVGQFSFCSLDTIPGFIHQNGNGGNYLFADMSVEYLTVARAFYVFNNNDWYIQ